MIHIDKGPEPPELVEHRASSPDATYGDFRATDALRLALAREQGHLCAYCMGRISPSPEGMKIEHWYPQHAPPPRPAPSGRHRPAPRGPLDYGNLLGVCKGGEGRPWAKQHCDTRKGNRPLTIDPLDHPERFIRYGADGSIHATDPAIEAELEDVLNLNVDHLRHNRKSAWDGVYAALKRGGAKSFRPGELRRHADRLRQPGLHDRLTEYCGYIAFFLDKKLRRAQPQPQP